MDTSEHSEVLRYLGYRGQEIDDGLKERISRMSARLKEVACPRTLTRAYPSSALLLPGNDMKRHLAGAEEVVLLAVTLGHGVDRELRRLAVADPLGQVVFDAAATALTERVANECEARIREEAAARGRYCSWRFSAGYGDLPLSVQPQILSLLDATRRLGITLTADNLMVPTKSVTALCGIHPTPQEAPAATCAICQLRPFCTLRARGMACAGSRGSGSD